MYKNGKKLLMFDDFRCILDWIKTLIIRKMTQRGLKFDCLTQTDFFQKSFPKQAFILKKRILNVAISRNLGSYKLPKLQHIAT